MWRYIFLLQNRSVCQYRVARASILSFKPCARSPDGKLLIFFIISRKVWRFEWCLVHSCLPYQYSNDENSNPIDYWKIAIAIAIDYWSFCKYYYLIIFLNIVPTSSLLPSLTRVISRPRLTPPFLPNYPLHGILKDYIGFRETIHLCGVNILKNIF